ncbi:MAG: pyridoxamine 5'-phosphate oxidase family protein, partial [Defluviitaleaceae bacterium]|nr:pyridoxamine 5'-phosphate oxidase family protein [Defluviitaleaceae bacterium]
ISADEVINTLEKENTLVLATCADDRVTIRPMSHINFGLNIYFQTGEDYLKVHQIKENPYVALYVGTFEIEGKAEVIGHPLAEENKFFIEKYKVRQPKAYELYSHTQELVIKVTVGRVRRWQYLEDGKPGVAMGVFNEDACCGS